MKEKFDEFLKNGIPEYDAKYLNDQKYVIMIMSKDGEISYALGNEDYTFLVEYPDINKSYSSPLEVLEEELKLCNSDNGIIYENIDAKGNFQPIALIENKKYVDLKKVI